MMCHGVTFRPVHGTLQLRVILGHILFTENRDENTGMIDDASDNRFGHAMVIIVDEYQEQKRSKHC